MTSPAITALGRRQFTALLAMIMALGALGIDLMLPVFDEIRGNYALATDSTRVAQIVTTYFLGMAVGQIFYGPFADRFGRKAVLYFGLSVYGAATIASALAPTLELMLISRFVWGLGAAGPRVMAVATVRDVYEGDEMARAMSFIMAVFVTVPIFAPSLGAAVAALGPWQLVFWFAAVYASVVALWSRRLPETLAPEQRRDLRIRPILDAAREVVTHRQSISYTVAMTLLFGAFSSYLASSELVVGEIYGRPSLFPIIFGVVATGMGTAMLLNAKLVERFGVHTVVRRAVAGYTALAGGLLVVTLATSGKPPFWLAVGWVSAVLVAHATMIPNVNAIALEPLGHIAGMASAVIGTISLAGGALLGAVIDGQMGTTVTPLVASFVVFGFGAAGLVIWAESGRSRAVAAAGSRV